MGDKGATGRGFLFGLCVLIFYHWGALEAKSCEQHPKYNEACCYDIADG